MSDTTNPTGLVWHSLPYQPAERIDVQVPDLNDRCETTRHSFTGPRPRAQWIEMLLWPGSDGHVSRCWKTCDECHDRERGTGPHALKPASAPRIHVNRCKGNDCLGHDE
jgi:hypothetical protein